MKINDTILRIVFFGSLIIVSLLLAVSSVLAVSSEGTKEDEFVVEIRKNVWVRVTCTSNDPPKAKLEIINNNLEPISLSVVIKYKEEIIYDWEINDLNPSKIEVLNQELTGETCEHADFSFNPE